MPPIADAATRHALTLKWLHYNLLSALVSGVVSVLTYALRYLTDAPEGRAAAGMALLYFAVIVLSAFSGAVYGVLTGAVLQRLVPALSSARWVGLHAAMAVGAGLLAEMAITGAADAPRSPDENPLADTLLIGLVFGAVCGTGMGALQALVLRRVALGSGTWMVWSAAAFTASTLFVLLASRLWDSAGGFAGEVTTDLLSIIGFVLGSIIMLPGLWALRSPMLSRAGRPFE
ncbi:MAG: hypothetical protein ACJ8F3_16950 [Xanthobacteraceae bacterium]